jgi:hypothetical protein
MPSKKAPVNKTPVKRGRSDDSPGGKFSAAASPDLHQGCNGCRKDGADAPCGRMQAVLDHDPVRGVVARVAAVDCILGAMMQPAIGAGTFTKAAVQRLLKVLRERTKGGIVSLVQWRQLSLAEKMDALNDDDGTVVTAFDRALTTPAAQAVLPQDFTKRDTARWIVHMDATTNKWVCSDCDHLISQHPQGDTASPRRQRNAAATARSSTASPSRGWQGKVAEAYGNTCPLTGEPRNHCDVSHIFAQAQTVPAFVETFPHLEGSAINSTGDVLLLRRDLSSALEHAEFAFEATKTVGEYTVFVPLHVSPALNALRGKTVKLAADPQVLQWHLGRAKACLPTGEPGGKPNGGAPTGGKAGGADKSAGGTNGRKKPKAGGRGKSAGGDNAGGGGAKKAGGGGDDDDDCSSQDLGGCDACLPRTPVHSNPKMTAFNLALSQVAVR